LFVYQKCFERQVESNCTCSTPSSVLLPSLLLALTFLPAITVRPNCCHPTPQSCSFIQPEVSKPLALSSSRSLPPLSTVRRRRPRPPFACFCMVRPSVSWFESHLTRVARFVVRVRTAHFFASLVTSSQATLSTFKLHHFPNHLQLLLVPSFVRPPLLHRSPLSSGHTAATFQSRRQHQTVRIRSRSRSGSCPDRSEPSERERESENERAE
jgi:hypothetical protein